jgi:hypothetical protein
MRIIFLKEHNNFNKGDVCEVLDTLASSLYKLGVAKLYEGVDVEIMPTKEPEKEVVYVPIIVNEEQLMEQMQIDEHNINYDTEMDKGNKIKSKLK